MIDTTDTKFQQAIIILLQQIARLTTCNKDSRKTEWLRLAEYVLKVALEETSSDELQGQMYAKDSRKTEWLRLAEHVLKVALEETSSDELQGRYTEVAQLFFNLLCLVATDTDITDACLTNGSFATRDIESLTPRERDIAVLVALGLTNREIAEQLTMSIRTVETHVSHLLNKLHCTTRTQIAHLIIAAGLLYSQKRADNQ